MADASISTLSIIGTAGRGDDLARLDRAVYDRMAAFARAAFGRLGASSLVSGGAAWADHLAVRLALEGLVEPSALTLHLPAPLAARGFAATRDGETSNRYHRRFSERAGVDSLGELAEVVARGARVTASPGFFARNALVATSDALLAFTFGAGDPWEIVVCGPHDDARRGGLKDGGTARTWDASRSVAKLHVTLGPAPRA